MSTAQRSKVATHFEDKQNSTNVNSSPVQKRGTAVSMGELRPSLDEQMLGPTSARRIFDQFLEISRASPHAVALVHEDGIWTYQELEHGSRALASDLLSHEAPNNVVALYATRSPEVVLGMLACLRAGLTFVILDLAYPAERLEQMCAIAAPGRTIAFTSGEMEMSSDDGPPRLERLRGEQMRRASFRFDKADVSSLLRRNAPRVAGLDAVSACSNAYLLFTSGTTGTPKCIKTSHHPLVHFIDWYAKTFLVDSSCRFSMLSGLGHDPLLRDVLIPLSFGAQLHIPSPHTLQDPPKLYAWLAESAVSHLHVTPQMSRLICCGRQQRGALEKLKFLFSGGDILRTKLVLELSSVVPAAQIVNFYGTSETPQAMGFHLFRHTLDANSDTVPIGRGIADAQLLVLDKSLRPAELGERGQIVIRTQFLSGGYLADSVLSSSKFVPNPNGSDSSDLLYLTGDFGRFRSDGAVVAIGRVDDQVKIRGFRVELAEVALHLERLPNVEAAVVLSEQSQDGENRLIAFVVTRPGVASDASAMRTELKAALALTVPFYMVPFEVVLIESVPLSQNGKVDRARLYSMRTSTACSGTLPGFPYKSLNAIESAIVIEWLALLGLRLIDVNSSFLQLGGDSLSTISAAMQLEDILGVLPKDWEKLSIRALANHKQEMRSVLTRVDTTVLVRAVSIVAIVAAHFDFPNLAGTVRTLFVVSGMSFGKYVVKKVLCTNNVRPILRLVLKIAAPTVLYTVFLDIALLHHFNWSAVVVLNNVIHADFPNGGHSFWFVIVLVQSLSLLACLLAVRPVRECVRSRPFEFAWCGTILLAGVAAITHLGDRRAFYDHLPTVHMGAMFLGWAAVQAHTSRHRLWVLMATLATFAEPVLRARDHELALLPFVATFCLLYWPQISLPMMLGKIVNRLAGASLFIYLTDMQVKKVAEHILRIQHSIINLVLAVMTGMIVLFLWEGGVAFAIRRLRRATITV